MYISIDIYIYIYINIHIYMFVCHVSIHGPGTKKWDISPVAAVLQDQLREAADRALLERRDTLDV